MKVALLLPGLWRLNDLCFNNLNDIILSKYDVDIYIATWNGLARCGVHEKKDFEYTDPKTIESLFFGLYGERIKKFQIFDYNSNPLTERRNNIREIADQCPIFRGAEKILSPSQIELDTFWISRLLDQYLLWRQCFDLIEDEYDLYIRHRGDVTIEKFNLNLFDGKNLVVCWNEGSEFKTGDQFAFGSKEGMSRYCSLYDHFMNYDTGLPIVAEKALQAHLDNVFKNYIIDEDNKIEIHRERL